MSKFWTGWSCLSEGGGVQAVFAGYFESDIVAAFGVPCGLSSSFDLWVDLVVVWGRKHAQVVRSCNGSAVLRIRVSYGRWISRNTSFLHIITCLCADQESLMAEHSINIGGGASKHVKKGTRMEIRLLELEVELGIEFLRFWLELRQDFSFQAFSERVGQLELCVK